MKKLILKPEKQDMEIREMIQELRTEKLNTKRILTNRTKRSRKKRRKEIQKTLIKMKNQEQEINDKIGSMMNYN